MTRLRLAMVCLLSCLLSGCVTPPPERHGDFTLAGDFRFAKNNRTLDSPRFIASATGRKTLKFTATGLPFAIDPLAVNLSERTLDLADWQSVGTHTHGGLIIQACAFPSGTLLGTYRYRSHLDRETGRLVTRCGKLRLVKDFTLRVRIEEPFQPDREIGIGYLVRLK